MKEFIYINKVTALKVWCRLSFSYWRFFFVQINLFVLFLALLVQAVSGRCFGWGLWKAVSVYMPVAQICWLAQPLLPVGALFQLIVDEPKCSLCQLRMPLTLHLCFPACTATLRNNGPTTGTLREVQLLTMPMPCDSHTTAIWRGEAMAETEFHLGLHVILFDSDRDNSLQSCQTWPSPSTMCADPFHPRARPWWISAHDSFKITVACRLMRGGWVQLGKAGLAEETYTPLISGSKEQAR